MKVTDLLNENCPYFTHTDNTVERFGLCEKVLKKLFSHVANRILEGNLNPAWAAQNVILEINSFENSGYAFAVISNRANSLLTPYPEEKNNLSSLHYLLANNLAQDEDGDIYTRLHSLDVNESAISYFIRQADNQIVESLLIKAGMPLDSLLFVAVLQDNVEYAQKIIGRVNVNVLNAYEANALFYARSKRMFDFLVLKGCNLAQRDYRNESINAYYNRNFDTERGLNEHAFRIALRRGIILDSAAGVSALQEIRGLNLN